MQLSETGSLGAVHRRLASSMPLVPRTRSLRLQDQRLTVYNLTENLSGEFGYMRGGPRKLRIERP
jgi:hypothetical protein